MAALARGHARCYVGDVHGRVHERDGHEGPFTASILARGCSPVHCLLPTNLLFSDGDGGLVVGTAAGTVTYYHEGHAAIEHTMGAAIACLARHSMADRTPAVVAADVGGGFLIFGLSAQLVRRIRLVDVAMLAPRVRHPAATSVVSIRATDAGGLRRRRLLLAAGEHVLLQLSADGSPLDVGEAPSEVTALGGDSGLEGDHGLGGGAAEPVPSHATDAIFACRDGTLGRYPTMERLGGVGACVTAVDATLWATRGLIACCGQFDGALVMAQEGQAVLHVARGAGWLLCACLTAAPQLERAAHDLEPCPGTGHVHRSTTPLAIWTVAADGSSPEARCAVSILDVPTEDEMHRGRFALRERAYTTGGTNDQPTIDVDSLTT
jgi:hypothetical protein